MEGGVDKSFKMWYNTRRTLEKAYTAPSWRMGVDKRQTVCYTGVMSETIPQTRLRKPSSEISLEGLESIPSKRQRRKNRGLKRIDLRKFPKMSTEEIHKDCVYAESFGRRYECKESKQWKEQTLEETVKELMLAKKYRIKHRQDKTELMAQGFKPEIALRGK